MGIFRAARQIIGAATLSAAALASANAALAQEKLVATYGEVRTILAFKVADATIQKILPEGWQSSSIGAGPSKDANLTVSFIDWLVVQNPDGTPGEALRLAAVGVPAKQKGADATVSMVVAGLSSSASYIPGPYGIFKLAKASTDRIVRTEADGKSKVEESWTFKGDGENAIELQLQYARGVAAKGKVEVKVHSAIRPDFFRIYRIEQATDVVRSAATATDRAQRYQFKASGPQFAQIFDGSEQLISITSLPWYSRQVYLPNGGTQ